MTTTRGQSAIDFLDAAALISTAADLVRVPSVFDPTRPNGDETEAADVVCALLDGWSIAYTRRDVVPGRPNIVADLVGRRPGPILVLEGHTDVVTAGDRAAWQFDPFGGEVRDG